MGVLPSSIYFHTTRKFIFDFFKRRQESLLTEINLRVPLTPFNCIFCARHRFRLDISILISLKFD